jgi:hypothetical protein
METSGKYQKRKIEPRVTADKKTISRIVDEDTKTTKINENTGTARSVSSGFVPP